MSSTIPTYLNRQEQDQFRHYCCKITKTKKLSDTQQSQLASFFIEIGRNVHLSTSLKFQYDHVVTSISKSAFCPRFSKDIVSWICSFTSFKTLVTVIPLLDRNHCLQKNSLLQEHLMHRTQMEFCEMLNFTRALHIVSWNHFFRMSASLTQFDFNYSVLPEWQKPFLSESDKILIALGRHAKQLTYVKFGPQLTNEGLSEFSKHACNLTHFSQLWFSLDEKSSHISCFLRNCQRINTLNLCANENIIFEIGYFCPNLHSLTLDAESETGVAGIQALSRCTQLTYLDISGIDFSAIDIITISKALSRLTHFKLSDTNTDDEALFMIEKGCPYLKMIDVSFTLVTQVGIERYLYHREKAITYNTKQFYDHF